MSRQLRGMTNYQDGLAAEDGVARRYSDAGGTIVARRWRGKSGEVDLIVRLGAGLIFVEVKKAADFARAAERITVAQLARIASAAEEYLAREPLGTLTPVRIDVVLVNSLGDCEILENVTM
jgi:putative endonuclease